MIFVSYLLLNVPNEKDTAAYTLLVLGAPQVPRLIYQVFLRSCIRYMLSRVCIYTMCRNHTPQLTCRFCTRSEAYSVKLAARVCIDTHCVPPVCRRVPVRISLSLATSTQTPYKKVRKLTLGCKDPDSRSNARLQPVLSEQCASGMLCVAYFTMAHLSSQFK